MNQTDLRQESEQRHYRRIDRKTSKKTKNKKTMETYKIYKVNLALSTSVFGLYS